MVIYRSVFVNYYHYVFSNYMKDIVKISLCRALLFYFSCETNTR